MAIKRGEILNITIDYRFRPNDNDRTVVIIIELQYQNFNSINSLIHSDQNPRYFPTMQPRITPPRIMTTPFVAWFRNSFSLSV